jgi:uncharacterized protein
MAVGGFLLFIAAGWAVGFFAGLFGVGGGVLAVPLLVFTYARLQVAPSVLTHIAIGTSLWVVIFASLGSAYQQKRQKNIHWRAVLVLGGSSAFTALATTRVAAEMNGRFLRIAFACLVIAAGVKMLTESKTQAERRLILEGPPSTLGLIAVGLIAGIVASLAGVGGGVITIPMMYYFLNMPLKLAIGTSSATIVFTAVFSVFGYIFHGIGHPDLPGWCLGFIDLYRGTALAIGTVMMAGVGAYISFKTSPYRLRRFFAVFTMVMALWTLLK